MIAPMPDLTIGSNYSFSQIMAAYHADPQGADDAHFLVYRGDEFLALCLRYKFNPNPHEVWVGNDPAVALWGERLAQCKDKKSVPLYYSPKSRTFYEFKGHHLITGDTTDLEELAKRKGPVPLSRIVFLKKA